MKRLLIILCTLAVSMTAVAQTTEPPVGHLASQISFVELPENEDASMGIGASFMLPTGQMVYNHVCYLKYGKFRALGLSLAHLPDITVKWRLETDGIYVFSYHTLSGERICGPEI